MARITVNGVSWDPVEEEGAGRATAARSAAASSSNYILVQTEGPLTDQQREQLAALGARVREYVPDNTYLCEYAPADLDGIRALDFVSWAGDYGRA